jgi:glycosyltransferase involved in cell wall biosynthesis
VRRERIRVVHNGVIAPTVMDREARRRTGLDGTIPIVAVGRLSREKGHDLLIDACASLADRDLFTLVFVGEGPERSALLERARRARVQLRIEGFRENVHDYYASAEVFVLPSRTEGSPNALLEAMACGCPIVAAAVGGVPEIVEHGHSALLAHAGSSDALRLAIDHLVRSPDLRAHLGAGAKRAAAAFSPAKRATALMQVYGAWAS